MGPSGGPWLHWDEPLFSLCSQFQMCLPVPPTHTLLPLPTTICHLPGGSHQNRAGGGAVPLNLQNCELNKPVCSPLVVYVKHFTAVTQSWLVTGPEQNRRQREIGSRWNTHRPCSRLSGLQPCPAAALVAPGAQALDWGWNHTTSFAGPPAPDKKEPL